MCFTQFTYAQTDSKVQKYVSFDNKLHLGDEFTYVAKYAFLNLGELRIKVYAKDTVDEKIIYKSVAYIDSYEGLPFVDLHQTYESWFDSSLQPIYFQAFMFYEEDTSYTKYYFKEDNLVHILKGKLHEQKASLDTVVYLDSSHQDGLSILFFVRFNTNRNDTLVVPCFVNEDTASTIINYYFDQENVSIDAINYDVDCFKIDGETFFTGIFGLSGYFEGWITKDEYQVPVAAELEVMIGHIRIELMEWNKNKWQPPEFKDN
ncbi:MAG: DUF3108 domain-containing protein [Ignavibacteriaceae bacterium]|jgi:hypothetical protein